MHTRLTTSTLFAAVVVLASFVPAQATLVPTVIFEETFDTPSGDAAVDYPAFVKAGGGTATVSTGRLVLTNLGSSPRDLAFFTSETFSGELFTVKGRVNQIDGGPGSTANGLVIGNRAFTFFGDFAGAAQGAFNILSIDTTTGQVTGTLVGDTNMGYVPAKGVFHSYVIEVDPTAGNFEISIFDGNGSSASPFVFSHLGDAGFIPGGVGFFNWASSHTTRFDDLQVIALREFIPEPSTGLLLAIGAAGLVRVRRRK